MKKVSVGVIGIGAMGIHHARNFTQIPGVTLLAIADINRNRGQKTANQFHCRFYSDYRKLLADKDITAVTIAVPTSAHFKVAQDALSAGKHVLVEKPITDNSTNAGKLINLAQKKNLILAVGHLERFNPAVLALKRYLSGGEIGKIVSLSAKRVGLYPSHAPDTNVITDLAIHDLDIFTFLLEEFPINIHAVGGKDYTQILLSYKDSVGGSIEVNWITPVKIRRLAVTGTKGYMELDYIRQKLRIYRRTTGRGFVSFGDFLAKFAAQKSVEMHIKREEPLRVQLRAFADCVRTGGKFPSDGKVGLEALLLAEKALSSLSKNIMKKYKHGIMRVAQY